jgi:oligosaccharyl transferase complex subunit OST4
MISDDGLYRLAVFLGSAAMLMIILYHFLEVNSTDEPELNEKSTPAQAGGKSAAALR